MKREVGDLIFTKHWTTSGWSFTIDQADPKILIQEEFLREIGDCSEEFEHVSLEFDRPPNGSFTDARIHFAGSNRTVIYRIGEHDRWNRTYEAVHIGG